MFGQPIFSRSADCLAEDPVCCEPVSGPKFPLTGKFTGNFAGSSGLECGLPRKILG